MDEKSFEIFLLYCFKKTLQTSEKILIRWSEREYVVIPKAKEKELIPILDVAEIHFNKECYVIRLMHYANKKGIGGTNKDIRLILSSPYGELEERMKKREVKSKDVNFLFNVWFKHEDQAILPSSQQFHIFYYWRICKLDNSEFIKNFFLDSICLCENLNDCAVYLAILKGNFNFPDLLCKVLLHFKIDLLAKADQSILQDFHEFFEILGNCEHIYDSIAKSTKGYLKNEHELALQLKENYQILLLVYFLKTGKWKEFIDFQQDVNFSILENISQNKSMCFLSQTIILAIISSSKFSSRVLENIILMAENTETKLDLIYNKLREISYPTSELCLNRMLSISDYGCGNIHRLLAIIQDKYSWQLESDIGWSNKYLNHRSSQQVPDFSIGDFISTALSQNNDINTLILLSNFLYKFPSITKADVHQNTIKTSLTERITMFTDNQTIASYYTDLRLFSLNFPDLLKSLCLSNVHAQKIIQSSTTFEFSQVDDSFINIFTDINFSFFTDIYFTKFITHILDKVKSLEDLSTVWKLFPLTNIRNYKDARYLTLCEKLIPALCNNMPTKESAIIVDQYSTLLVVFLAKGENLLREIYPNFLNSLYQSMRPVMFISLQIQVMETIESPVLLNIILMDIKEKFSTLNPANALKIIPKVLKLQDSPNGRTKMENLLYQILDHLTIFSIKPDDFFKEVTDNLLFLSDIINLGVFQVARISSTLYYSTTLALLNEIREKIIEQRLTIQQYLDISTFSEDELFLKMKLVCLGNEEQTNRLINISKELINTSYDIYKSIKNVITFAQNFLKDVPSIQSEIQEIQKIRESIAHESLCIVSKKYNSIPNIVKLCIITEKMCTLHQSQIFKNFVEKEKSTYCSEHSLSLSLNLNLNDKILILERSYDKFQNLRQLFDEKVLQNTSVIELDNLFIFAKDRISICKELFFLKQFFALDPSLADYLEQTIIKIFTRNITVQQLANCVKLLELFHVRHVNVVIDKENSRELLQDLNATVMQYNNTYKNIIGTQFHFVSKEPYSTVIELLVAHPEVLSFLENKKEDDIRGLIEFVDDIGDSHINVESAKDLIKVLGFILDLASKNDEISEQEFLTKFEKSVKTFSNIQAYLSNVVQNFHGIQQLYSKIVNREEFSKIKIKEIYNSSIFQLSHPSNSGYDIKVSYGERLNQSITYNEVIELRDRSLLFSKKKIVDKQNLLTSLTIFEEEEIRCIQICQNFSRIIDDVLNLLTIANELHAKGYPKDFPMKIIVQRENVIVHIDEEEKSIEDVKEEMRRNLQRYNEELILAYERYPVIRFLYGRQFNRIYKYLLGRSVVSEVIDILKYLTIDESEMAPCMARNLANEGNIKEMFDQVHDFLMQYLDTKIGAMLESNSLGGNHVPGIYCFLVSETHIEVEILQAYLMLTGNVPLLHTILICSESTTSEQIFAFLYRSLKSSANVPFFIIKADKLCLEKRRELAYYIQTLYTHDMKSSLFLTYFAKESDLIEQVRKIKSCRNFCNERLDFKSIADHVKKCITSVEIVSSDASGIGMSTYIKQNAEENGEYYIYFPVGGEITWESLITRFKKLEFPSDEATRLHIDLNESSNVTVMKDFLFSLLITGGICSSDEIFTLERHVKISVEIPCGFVNFWQQYQILNIFPQICLSKDNPPEMIVSMDKYSNIQIVCNYLKALEAGLLDENTIYISCNCDADALHNPYCSFHRSLEWDSLPKDQCEWYIRTYMAQINPPTYYQINSFINILADQFKFFSSCFYLHPRYLQNNGFYMQKRLVDCRPIMIRSLIRLTAYFTNGAYSNLIAAQEFTHVNYHMKIYSESDFEKDKQKALEFLEKKNIITFDQIPVNLVFFNEDGFSMSIISNDDKYSEENQKLSEVWSSGEVSGTRSLVDYRSLTHTQFLEEIGNVLDTVVKPEDTNMYVFTTDNFIKMILILLRTRARIPVIMMGETGCGKTSLIRMLAKIKKQKMEIFSIHAGINDEDIIYFMKSKVIPTTQTNTDDVIWVFFDEINTCNSMGLISEIMCKNSMHGEPLPSNIAFAAACNPYRKIVNFNLIDSGLVNKREHAVRKLVYSVNPLPHSLLNFVFDFGSLTPTDEQRYITTMLLETILDENLRHAAVKGIIASQNFIRALYEVSSVSLRDVRRFVILYKWFMKSFEGRIALAGFQKYDKMSSKALIVHGIILSLFICYYIRIPCRRDREDYKLSLAKSINSGDNVINLSTVNLQEIFNDEMNDIATRIHPPKGIARNTALLENLFTLFVCVNNKIPVFLCGKPGYSKTLSVQLLYSAMRGQDSSDDYFKTLPRLFMSCYQGSMTSTSQGILNVFQKARNILKDKKDDANANANAIKEKKNDIISMIFFDEMGLAEISKNNPLKVIHSELELDQDKESVAFVGISNWRLDASKMNRGVFLFRTDPDEEDLINTARTIATSYQDERISSNEEIFKIIAQTYFRYKNFLKERRSDIEEFHGSRDFYHLVKYVAVKIHEQDALVDGNILDRLSREALVRNFGGLKDSVERITSFFSELNQIAMPNAMQHFNVITAIQNSLLDKYSRYLILISKSSISSFLLYSILAENRIVDYTFLIGSQFDGDINQEDYSYKLLNKVQVCMEQGKLLVLKNLEIIFPSLYDLFNQNFTEVGGKAYARIALGISNNPMASVNKTFKCVILLDQAELEKQDPPFLNRFEKQIVSFEHILPEKLFANLKSIKKNINDITHQQSIVNFDDEEILGMIYQCSQKNISNPDLITSEILIKIAPTFSQEIIASIKLSKQYDEDIFKYYLMFDHRNFYLYLASNQSGLYHVIYTYSGILDPIQLKDMEEVTISMFRTESELENFLVDFYKNQRKAILLIKFRPNDCRHMNLVKFLIDSILRETKCEEKMVIFTIHLQKLTHQEEEEGDDDDYHQKNPKSSDLISHLSNYTQVFIDNLTSQCPLHITDLLDLKTEDFFRETLLFKIEDELLFYIYPCLMKIFYNFRNAGIDDDDDYRVKLNEKIFKNNQIQRVLISHLVKNLTIKDDVLTAILVKHECFHKNSDLISTIQSYLKAVFEQSLTVVLVNLEREDGIEFVMHMEEDVNFDNVILRIWEELITSVNFSMVKVSYNTLENKIEKVRGLRIPFIQREFARLLPLITHLSEQFLENEDMLRFSNFTKEEVEQSTYHLDQYQLVESVLTELEKVRLFTLLLREDARRLMSYEYLLRDFIKYFTVISGGKTAESEKCLEYLINLKFSLLQDKLNKNTLAHIILWCNTYSSIIQVILRDVDALAEYHGEVQQKIARLIDSRCIYYPYQDTKKEVNEIFFLMCDALVQICIPSKNLLESLDIEMFYRYLSQIKTISHDVSILDARLYFFGKALPELETFLRFQKLLEQGNDPNYSKEMLFRLEGFKQMETKITQEQFLPEQEESLMNLLDEQIRFFQVVLDEKNLHLEFVVDFCIGQYVKYKYERYRVKMLKMLVSHDGYLRYSKPFIELTMRKYASLVPGSTEDENVSANENSSMFCWFARVHDSYFEILENSQKDVLDEILLYIFESKILHYFDSLTNDDDVIHNLSSENFSKSIQHLESFYNNENTFRYIYPRLAFLYSIAYCKIFIQKYSYILYYKNQSSDFGEINKILGEDNSPVKNMMKIYVLKSILLHLGSYERLREFLIDKEKYQLTWASSFDFSVANTCSLNYLFISLQNVETYKILLQKYALLKDKKIKSEEINKDILPMIQGNQILLFIDLLINQVLSNTFSDSYVKSSDFANFSAWAQSIANDLQIGLSINAYKLLSLFLLQKEYLSLLSIITSSNHPDLKDIFFASYKLAFICFNSDISTFYGYLTNCENLFQNFSTFFLPGADSQEFRLAQAYKEISDYLHFYNNYTHGAYVCSCGFWYQIEPCGSPWQISACPECGLDIGGKYHALVKREGHYRVYLDERQKLQVESQFSLVSLFSHAQSNSSKLLAELKQEVDMQIRSEKPGFKNVKKEKLGTKNKQVRNLTSIAYRILSFILFSILFYGNCIGVISDKNLSEMINGCETECMAILEIHWSILKSELAVRGVNEITIFINLLIDKLIPIFSGCRIISTYLDRLQFEEQVNTMIEELLAEYSSLEKRYKENNREIVATDLTSIKTIIEEREDVGLYNGKEYPFMKYLWVTTYPSEADMRQKLFAKGECYRRFPVMCSFLELSEGIKKLGYLEKINPIVNFMINRHSYKTSRDEAKHEKFTIEKDLNDINDLHATQLFNQFTEAWKKIYTDAVKFECAQSMPPALITSYYPIAYLLNDNGEHGNGMYLAAAYQNFIEYQNSFINSVLTNISQGGIASHFKESLMTQIKVQDASPNEILSTKLPGDFSTLGEYITMYSIRDIFSQKEINYYNYKNIVYDFEKLEDIIASLVLPGKKSFATEQKFVTYAYEAYRGENSGILGKFVDNHPQVLLCKNEKEIVARFCNAKPPMPLLNSLHMLVFYLHSFTLNPETSITSLIAKLPAQIRIDDDLKSYFERNPSFTISKLVDILEYTELTCFGKILEHVNDDYKLDIQMECKKTITDYFSKAANNFINQQLLATVVRKFISRVLGGKLGRNVINMKENLILMIRSKFDLWPHGICDDTKWENEMNLMQESFDVKVNQAVMFYEFLGGDQQLILKLEDRETITRATTQESIMVVNSSQKQKLVQKKKSVRDF